MEVKALLDLTKSWDENQIRELMRQLNLRRDMVTRLWSYIFNKIEVTFYERDRTTEWINTYGYKNVLKAMTEAKDSGVQEKSSIRYIQKVLENMKQKESIEKEKALQQEKLKEVALISGDKLREKTDLQPNKWVGFAKRVLDE